MMTTARFPKRYWEKYGTLATPTMAQGKEVQVGTILSWTVILMLSWVTLVESFFLPCGWTRITRRHVLPSVCPTDQSVMLSPALPTRSSHQGLFRLYAGIADDSDDIDPEDLENLTLDQLKQQLRLRGLPATGKRQEMLDRLLGKEDTTSSSTTTNSNTDSSLSVLDNAVKDVGKVHDSEVVLSDALSPGEMQGTDNFALESPADLGVRRKGFKSFRFSDVGKDPYELEDDEDDEEELNQGKPEIWGSDAMIVKDFQGESRVLDGISRTLIQFQGGDRANIQAYMAAHGSALRPYSMGGKQAMTHPETRVRQIQERREQLERESIQYDVGRTLTGEDANELEYEPNVMDTGKYSLTGIEISAREVKGVILLSDMDGPYSKDFKALADRLAFECQPTVVLAPDVFRDNPWRENTTNPNLNDQGETFQEWKAKHPEDRIHGDIRATASLLRERYGVAAVVVWGLGLGGRLALEVASGALPEGSRLEDFDLAEVNPNVAVAWYPTNYNASALFGPQKDPKTKDPKDPLFNVAAIFGGEDDHIGARRQDATLLKAQLRKDPRVNDHMVKVFPNQDHGFALEGMSAPKGRTAMTQMLEKEFGDTGKIKEGESPSDMAFVLSSAFMESYARLFLPTGFTPISQDERAHTFNDNLDVTDWTQDTREMEDVAQDNLDAIENFNTPPIGGIEFNPDAPNSEERLAFLLRSMDSSSDVEEGDRIQHDDSMEDIIEKLKKRDGAFKFR